MLSITKSSQDKTTVLTLAGGFVAGNIDELKQTIKALIAEGRTTLELSFGGVDAVDSAGVGLLAAIHNSLAKANGSLAVTAVRPDMYKFFMAMRLNSHFKVEEQK